MLSGLLFWVIWEHLKNGGLIHYLERLLRLLFLLLLLNFLFIFLELLP
jgi:hypothetical protein